MRILPIIFILNTVLAPDLMAQQPEDFVKIKDMSSDFVYDMRYATTNNFLETKVYECPDCVVRKEVADALVKANKSFMEQGYKIKFFDCYRPLYIQKLMWQVYPDAKYVANPDRGSVHNRGGAVDITLVTLEGKELDMGTEFDFFGEKAHHSYQEFDHEILFNRQVLKNGMEKYGFSPIRTEWWHYNFNNAKKFKISNFKVDCD